MIQSLKMNEITKLLKNLRFSFEKLSFKVESTAND